MRRMDLDRVLRACRESKKFHKVQPFGYGCLEKATIYKKSPWEHMNSYTLKAKLEESDPVCEIGANYNVSSIFLL